LSLIVIAPSFVALFLSFLGSSLIQRFQVSGVRTKSSKPATRTVKIVTNGLEKKSDGQMNNLLHPDIRTTFSVSLYFLAVTPLTLTPET
jgi:hypothetical protein